MQKVQFNENASKNIETLKTGAFLTTKDGGFVNTMTIGWGMVGFQWGKPVFTVMVRKSRKTFEMIEKAGEFTVSIPYGDEKANLGICGSKSGRDTDKIKECGFALVKGESIDTPILDIQGMHFECKTLYKSAMDESFLAKFEDERWYSDKDYHTFYFGEILNSYVK